MRNMESSSPSSLSTSDFIVILFLRPLLAIAFVLSLISLGWLLAWKLVLVHVPLVQDIFGLKKKKPLMSKPQLVVSLKFTAPSIPKIYLLLPIPLPHDKIIKL